MATRRVIASGPTKEQSSPVGSSPEPSVQPTPATVPVKEASLQTQIQRPQKQDQRTTVVPKKDPIPIKSVVPQAETRPSPSMRKPAVRPAPTARVVAAQKPKAAQVKAPLRHEQKPAAKPVSSGQKTASSHVFARKEVTAHKPVQRSAPKPASKRPQSHDDESSDATSWPLMVFAAVLGLIILGILWATWDNSAPRPVQNTSTETSYGRFGYDPARIQTFSDLYAEIKILDERYQTDLHQERLGKDMIQPKFIAGYVDRVDALSAAVNASGSNETEIEINTKFLEARRRMLISQDYFHKALRFGTKGVVTTSFNCVDVPTVLKATELYNQSLEIGRFAIPRLDFVLAKSDAAREVLGLNTQKMRWYVTTFGDIKHLVDTNLWLVDTLCVKRQSLNKTQDVVVDSARKEFEDNFPGAVVP